MGDLSNYDEVAVSIYWNYVNILKTAVDKKTGKLKNFWAPNLGLTDWVNYFEKVAVTGFFIDGENITINNNGISLNYQAYKNLVIKKYPEAVFDVQLVKEGDEFTFYKQDGKVHYNHSFGDPFGDKKIVGGYCVIKLRSGEFIELLSLKDLEQIRKTAKTDYIWNTWTSEMYIKTIIKRACKRHFKDAVEVLDSMDMENYDMPDENEVSEALQVKISACNTEDDLTKLWNEIKSDKRTKVQTKAVIDACGIRKQEIKKDAKNDNT